MSISEPQENLRQTWIAPEIRQLELSETSAVAGRGADAGGNPSVDCQRS